MNFDNIPRTHTIANSAGKSKLNFHDEISHSLKESVNVERTIMEVEKRGKVYVLKADFMATSIRTNPGDTAKCPALGMGDMDCKILRLASVFSTRVTSYLDDKNEFYNGKGISFEEVLAGLKK